MFWNYVACAFLFLGWVVASIWAIRAELKRNRKRRRRELQDYVDRCYHIKCLDCEGTGYEGYALDGEPTGEFCEKCESYGFLWRSICPPRWLKHGCIWRQSEFEKLQKQACNPV